MGVLCKIFLEKRRVTDNDIRYQIAYQQGKLYFTECLKEHSFYKNLKPTYQSWCTVLLLFLFHRDASNFQNIDFSFFLCIVPRTYLLYENKKQKRKKGTNTCILRLKSTLFLDVLRRGTRDLASYSRETGNLRFNILIVPFLRFPIF